MEPEVQVRKSTGKGKNVILIIITVFIVLMLSATSVFAYLTLQNSNIYKGVRIGNQDVSGMGLKELKQDLDTRYQSVIDQLEITLKTEKCELKTGYPELNVHYDTQLAAQNAYSVGREGNIFKRLYDIAHAGLNGVDLEVPMSFDEAKVDSFVNRFYDMTFMKVQEGAMLITDSSVILRSGSHGENIDKTKILGDAKALINERKGGVIEPEVTITLPTKFNTDEIYKQIISEPADAFYKVENSVMTLVPHVVGRQVDKTALQDIVTGLEKTEKSERVLPVNFVSPAVTSEIAASMLFRDELGTANTYFSTSTENGRNRKYNMGLAVEKINNMILAPGQEFSFNDVVGPRDLEHGYKLAHIYISGKITDGVGGGICQVTTTMYNAVLKADLTVTERRNHSFTVAYVPLGQDATAYYGATDFRFVNSSNWPMQLLATIKGNRIYFTIKGTLETPGKTVIISNKILKETPFTVKYTDDPTLPVGTEKEVQEGLNGYIVETYKTIKMGDKVVSETKLHTSTYKAYAQIVRRGTKPVSPAGGTVTAPVSDGSSGTAAPSNAANVAFPEGETGQDDTAPSSQPEGQDEVAPPPL